MSSVLFVIMRILAEDPALDRVPIYAHDVARARLLAVSAKESGAWLKALPVSHG